MNKKKLAAIAHLASVLESAQSPVKPLNKYPSLSGFGRQNSFHGNLNILEPSLANISRHFAKSDRAKALQSEVVPSKVPMFKMNQRLNESSVFDGLAMIDMMLELINITIITKIEGTEFDSMDAKFEMANIKNIIEDLRKNWVRKRLKFKSLDSEDFTLNEHAAEVYELFDNLAFKPTDLIVGLNYIFNHFFKGEEIPKDFIK